MNGKKENNAKFKFASYFKYMIFILIFVEILDTYTTNNLNVVVSNISTEFFPNLSENASISFYQIFIAIATFGMYFVFFNQYLADKIGRKPLLVFTVFGMGMISLFIATLSYNIIIFTILLFLMYFFFNSDIWVIYINEESPINKRAFYTNFVLIGGVIGALLIPFFHDIIINWRGMTYFAIILGIPLSLIIFLTFKETSKYLELKENRSLIDTPKIFKKNLSSIFQSTRRNQFIVILIISLIIGLNYLFLLVGEDFLSKNFNKSDVDTVIWIMSISSIIGYLITGLTADKIGRKPLCYLYSILFPISITLVVIGVNFSKAALTVVSICAGIANLSFWGLRILISIIALEIIPTNARGTGTGLKTLVSSLGMTIGLFLSSIITYTQGLAVSFIVFSLLFLIVLPLIYFFLKETKGVNLSEVK